MRLLVEILVDELYTIDVSIIYTYALCVINVTLIKSKYMRITFISH